MCSELNIIPLLIFACNVHKKCYTCFAVPPDKYINSCVSVKRFFQFRPPLFRFDFKSGVLFELNPPFEETTANRNSPEILDLYNVSILGL